MQMLTAVVPTSMGSLIQHTEAGGSGGQHPPHQAVYMGHALPPQAHAPTPGPQPQQPPTPQGHVSSGAGGAPGQAVPTQPPTPGPTPPQQIIYGNHGHVGGQPSLQQHLPQHSPHGVPQQYLGHGAALAGGSPHIVMLPPHVGQQMMHPGGPPPHSTTHIPSTMAPFTPTSSSLQHMSHPHHISYISGKL